jgi:hypothetical protein
MPRQKAPSYLYTVFITGYASAEVKQAIETGSDRLRDPAQLKGRVVYSGKSLAQAERAFSRAAIEAYGNPLAFRIMLQRDSAGKTVTLARFQVERY